MDSNEVKADEAAVKVWTAAHPRTVSAIGGGLVVALLWVLTKIF